MRKQLLYLTSDHLCAYDWQQGRLSPGQRFPANADGLDQFAGHLERRLNVPAYLLTDLIEEDFQRQLLPHVGGKAGKELIQRRLNQLHRDTPFRMSTIQGRDSAGRRDNQVLFCALTNPSILQPWMEALEYLKIPLAGLYSSSLLGASLVGKLALREKHLLLVTQQSGGLRQSYFENGKLRFSRLTLAVDRDGGEVNIASETDKTRQFLTSTRMLGRGHVLYTAILTPAAQIDKLRARCRDGVEVAYHFIDIARAGARLGLRDEPQLADHLLLSLLGKHQPPGHYPLGPRARFYQLWRTRIGLYAASALIGACALLWLGLNLWLTEKALSSGDKLHAETASYDQRYHAIMSSLPPALANTQNMKTAVTLEHLIASQAPSPEPMMIMLSQALDKVPQINLTQLDWRVGLPGPKAAPAVPRQGNAPATPLSSLLVGIPTMPVQSLHVEAEVLLAQNDYRSALASVNQLTQELARYPKLSVEIVETPLDVRPTVKLAGKSATTPAESQAKFVLNLVWRP